MNNFLFHRVSPIRDALWDPMDPKLFEKCIRYISNRYDVVRIEDYIQNKDIFVNQKIATIQFDDGYKDNLQFAADILDKYSTKASFYIVTDCIDKNIPTWTHIIEHFFQSTTIKQMRLPFDFLPFQYQKVTFEKDTDYLNFAKVFIPYLKTLQHSQRTLVIDSLLSIFDNIQLPDLMMNWDDIKELNNAGHYIGSHTVTHPMLGTMEKDESQKEELLQSAVRIQNQLGYFPASISYPVGSYNEKTIKICKDVGYKFGLAVKQDTYDPDLDDDFEIPRIALSNEPWWKTKLRISNKLENIKRIIRYKNG